MCECWGLILSTPGIQSTASQRCPQELLVLTEMIQSGLECRIALFRLSSGEFMG